jgi:predicted metal-binding protein
MPRGPLDKFRKHALERELFLAGYYKAFAFGSCPCRACRSCDVMQPCKKPAVARPSMEAVGIDVFATVRANKFRIEVVTSDECQADYCGLVLVE